MPSSKVAVAVAPRSHLPGAAGVIVAGALSLMLWCGIAGVAVMVL